MPRQYFNDDLSGDNDLMGLDDLMGDFSLQGDDLLGTDDLSGMDDAMLGAAVRRRAQANKQNANRAQANRLVQAAAKAARTGAGLPATGVQILPFSSAQAIAASTTTQVIAYPQRPFRATRLSVSAETGANFRISSFDIGADPQFVSPGSVPAQSYQYDAVGANLKGSTAIPGILISATVTNQHASNAYFWEAQITGPSNDS